MYMIETEMLRVECAFSLYTQQDSIHKSLTYEIVKLLSLYDM